MILNDFKKCPLCNASTLINKRSSWYYICCGNCDNFIADTISFKGVIRVVEYQSNNYKVYYWLENKCLQIEDGSKLIIKLEDYDLKLPQSQQELEKTINRLINLQCFI